uniref:Peptidase_M13 domain-containing protein n=1 Tax=Rhabditophanes sp. KR3021 TaxID=114890 RepID=A0AC35TXU2_9BILA
MENDQEGASIYTNGWSQYLNNPTDKTSFPAGYIAKVIDNHFSKNFDCISGDPIVFGMWKGKLENFINNGSLTEREAQDLMAKHKMLHIMEGLTLRDKTT